MNILIIGATSGIGNSLYRHYASNGNRVAIMGRRAPILDELSAANPTVTLPVQADIADVDSFNDSLAKVIKSFGVIDLAILCAGVGELNGVLDPEAEQRTIATNVVGWTNAAASLYNYFESVGKGHLVTVTSVGGLQPAPVAPSYSASKAFQINYTKSLQAKARATGVTVTEIRPGLVDTRMAKGDGLFWVMPVEKVARQIIRAIDKKRKLCVVTRRWRLINYIVRHFM